MYRYFCVLNDRTSLALTPSWWVRDRVLPSWSGGFVCWGPAGVSLSPVKCNNLPHGNYRCCGSNPGVTVLLRLVKGRVKCTRSAPDGGALVMQRVTLHQSGWLVKPTHFKGKSINHLAVVLMYSKMAGSTRGLQGCMQCTRTAVNTTNNATKTMLGCMSKHCRQNTAAQQLNPSDDNNCETQGMCLRQRHMMCMISCLQAAMPIHSHMSNTVNHQQGRVRKHP